MLKLKLGRDTAQLKRFVYFLLAAIVCCALFFWRINTLSPDLSPAEVAYRQSVSTINDILSNPVYLPHKLLSFGLLKINDSTLSLRMASILMTAVFIISFYSVCKRWFGRFVALAATLLFASIPWIILNGRSGTPEIMLLSTLLLMSVFLWLSNLETKTLALFLLILTLGLSLYVPGMLWFILAGVVLLRGKVQDNLSELNRKTRLASLFLLILLIVPLIMAAVKDSAVLKTVLLIPTGFHSLTEILSSILWSVGGLVWKTRQHLYLSVGRLSILNATNMILAVFGTYIMWTKARREFYVLIILFLLGILASGLNENNSFLLLCLPSVGVLMAAGLRYLYGEWRTIFPLNPLPRALAFMLIGALVLLNLFVGVKYSLITWPHSLVSTSSDVVK
jgi:4-amino-4-deoxy-L-arabinose transferase-like glycosyltransferase